MLDGRRVYVQVPAYRDSELLVTIQSLIETASHPDQLRIAIAWQYGPDESHVEEQLRRYDRVELLKIPACESQGCNWARRLLQNGWSGEPYTLFIDSHHRFVMGWDEQIIGMYEALRLNGIAKPILTAYLPPYNPHADPQGRTECLFKIHVLERYQGLVFRLTGHAIPNWQRLDSPVRAHFTSLHFLFSGGIFNKDIPVDPLIYFFADEVAIALRAYTHGYDIFHPHHNLGWHLYDRSTRVTHWSDHPAWRKKQELSYERLRMLYGGKIRGHDGIGSVRSISDYEHYIGMPLSSGES
ncbi:MAG: UDP-N-acetylglucosamine-transferase [Nitrospira sp.]|nr:UDP-N-acetylglucosamine-transferase [Nitrospira sp.]